MEQVSMSDDNSDESKSPIEAILADTDAFVDVTVGISVWMAVNGMFILEEDYRIAGEVWRVHKGDADPFPSKPHAHCVGGAKRFIGCKLHLGTRELFKGSQSLHRFLDAKQFATLIALIQPKFSDIKLPLGN
jgi:hypothetical protein